MAVVLNRLQSFPECLFDYGTDFQNFFTSAPVNFLDHCSIVHVNFIAESVEVFDNYESAHFVVRS